MHQGSFDWHEGGMKKAFCLVFGGMHHGLPLAPPPLPANDRALALVFITLLMFVISKIQCIALAFKLNYSMQNKHFGHFMSARLNVNSPDTPGPFPRGALHGDTLYFLRQTLPLKR